MEGELENDHDDTGPSEVVENYDNNERERSKNYSDDDQEGDDKGEETGCLAYGNIDFS